MQSIDPNEFMGGGMAKRNLKVTVVVDNQSWILPFAEQLVARACELGCTASLVRSYEQMSGGDVALFIGCITIARPAVLARHDFNMVVHESDLPRGRGFAPIAWQVLEGRKQIPAVLFEATEGVDSGEIYLRDVIRLTGYELNDEIRQLQGIATINLCVKFLQMYPDFCPQRQEGEGHYYRRRTPKDSELSPDKSLREQFDLLRIVDNEQYPAYFEIDGHRYILQILRAPQQS